jgi:hypothetical protein
MKRGVFDGDLVTFQIAVAASFIKATFADGTPDTPMEYAKKLFKKNREMLKPWDVADMAKALPLFYQDILETPPAALLNGLEEERQRDPMIFQMTKNVAGEAIKAGEPLPRYTAEIMNGSEEPPKKRGPLKYPNDPRNFLIVVAIYRIATEFNMKVTRNEATAPGEACVCDVVENALRSCGCHMSYDNVIKIWQKTPLCFPLLLTHGEK